MKGEIECFYCRKKLKSELKPPYLLYEYSPICDECAIKQQKLALFKMKRYFKSLEKKEEKPVK
jgi:hypothetical protein